MVARYEPYIAQSFANFTLSLGLFPCGTSFYSYVRTCDESLLSYKDWLCAVTIPRCTDTGAPSSLLRTQEYGINGTLLDARNELVPSISDMGQYSEILPCLSLCNEVDRTTPSILGWICPVKSENAAESYSTAAGGLGGYPGNLNFRESVATSIWGDVSCNALGLDWILSWMDVT